MFILSARLYRNGASCREYYNPDVKEPIAGVVPASLLGDNKHEAKQYSTEEEARADIANFVAMTNHFAQAVEVLPV